MFELPAGHRPSPRCLLCKNAVERLFCEGARRRRFMAHRQLLSSERSVRVGLRRVAGELFLSRARIQCQQVKCEPKHCAASDDARHATDSAHRIPSPDAARYRAGGSVRRGALTHQPYVPGGRAFACDSNRRGRVLGTVGLPMRDGRRTTAALPPHASAALSQPSRYAPGHPRIPQASRAAAWIAHASL